MRMGHPLRDFYGDSKFYLYVSDCGLDGWAEYEDKASLAQFVVNVVEQELRDPKLSRKLARILGKEWKIPLRKRRMTAKQYFEEMDKRLRKNYK